MMSLFHFVLRCVSIVVVFASRWSLYFKTYSHFGNFVFCFLYIFLTRGILWPSSYTSFWLWVFYVRLQTHLSDTGYFVAVFIYILLTSGILCSTLDTSFWHGVFCGRLHIHPSDFGYFVFGFRHIFLTRGILCPPSYTSFWLRGFCVRLPTHTFDLHVLCASSDTSLWLGYYVFGFRHIPLTWCIMCWLAHFICIHLFNQCTK